MDNVLVAFVAVSVVVLGQWLRSALVKYFRRRKNVPPGPRKCLWFTHDDLLQRLLKQSSGSLHLAAMSLCREFNSDIACIRLGSEDVVFAQNDRLMEEFSANGALTGRPNTFFIRLRCMGVRQGITMTDGPFWEEQRAFAVRHLHDLGFGKTSTEFLIHEELRDLFSTMADRQTSVCFRQSLSKSLLNVLWAMVTGSRFTNDDELNGLISIMERRARAFQMTGRILDKYPWIRFVAPEWSGFNLIDRLNKKFKALIEKSIDEHKRTYSAHETRDFIDAFLHVINSKGHSSFTESQLVMVCFDLFIAGSQTTSSTLDFLILRMVTHPDVQRHVQAEIDSVLRSGQAVSISDRHNMPYTEAVLLESQRFAPSVPVIGPRRALSDTTLGGYNIPKDFTVFLNLYPYLRDETKWPNPRNFDPSGNMLNNDRLTKEDKYFAFGKGNRRCPGDSLAKAFMFIFFVSILQRFSVEMADANSPPTEDIVPGITCTPRPYEIRFIPRS